jgi:hypothetical protein
MKTQETPTAMTKQGTKKPKADKVKNAKATKAAKRQQRTRHAPAAKRRSL